MEEKEQQTNKSPHRKLFAKWGILIRGAFLGLEMTTLIKRFFGGDAIRQMADLFKTDRQEFAVQAFFLDFLQSQLADRSISSVKLRSNC